jgi:WD40 repeat protein
MATLARCPRTSCLQIIRIQPEYLGQRVRCPHCGEIITLPSTSPAAESPQPPAPAATLPLPSDTAPTASPAPATAVSPATLPLPGPPEQRAAPVPTLDDYPVPGGITAAPAAAFPSGAGPQAGAGVEVPARVGRFEIRERLGEGTFGVVYRAYDPQLDREVALKVAKPESLSNPQRVQRFLREAKAAGNLRHPHIVPVFDSGQDGPHYYIASAFIPGRSLAGELEQAPEGQGLDVRRATEVVRRLAEALAYAHGKGVVHRDVKPANAMLDEQGLPLLLDFGLAAREEGGEKLTQEAVKAMGTPAYMAPEQAAGEAGPASDQYGLGCTLYELLTGQTPFAGPPELQIFLHQTQPAPSPRRLNRRVPRDLETVCLKCLEKEPARRYVDCQALADDLRRFLDGEPVQARRIGLLERVARWGRRNPLSAGLVGVVAVSLLLGTTVAWALAAVAQENEARAVRGEGLAHEKQKLAEREAKRALEQQGLAEKAALLARQETKRAEKALSAEKKQKAEADGQRDRAEWKIYSMNLLLAQAAWERHDGILANYYLEACRPDRRGWEYRHLFTLFNTHNQQTMRGHSDTVHRVVYSPDGKHLASISYNEVILWDTQTGQKVVTPKGPMSLICSVAFSPDGKLLAYAGSGYDSRTKNRWGEFRLLDVATGQEKASFKGHADCVQSLAFSPDGKRLASASKDRTVQVWDTQTWEEVFTFRGHTRPVYSVVFSPDGKRLASASFDKTVRIWDAQTGQEVLTLKGFTSSAYSDLASIAINPDGGRLAYSPDGKRLASAFIEKAVRVWDTETGQEILTLKGHADWLRSVAFSPDGQRLATTSEDKMVKVWDAQTGQEIFTLKGHTRRAFSAAYSPDGQHLASGAEDKTVKIWNAQTGQEALTLQDRQPLVAAAFSPDGKRLATASGTVRVWDAQTGQEILKLNGGQCVVFSPDGKRLVNASFQTVKVWDAHTGQEVLVLRGHGSSVHSAAFSPDGKHLATGSGDKTVKIWDVQTGREVLALKGHDGLVRGVAYSPDGQRLASASQGKIVKVWDARTGQEIRTLKGHPKSWFTAVAFSPDGKRLASVSSDNTVKVWDVQTGQEVLTLRGHTAGVESVAYSPDGKRLASASSDKTVRIWDTQTGQEVLTLRGHTGASMSVAFSPDGQLLASASRDKTVRVWYAQGGLASLKGTDTTERGAQDASAAKAPRAREDLLKAWLLTKVLFPHLSVPAEVFPLPPLTRKTHDGGVPRVAGARPIELQSGAVQIKDKLTATDPRDRLRRQSACKAYTVKLLAGHSYCIDMTSDQLDSYLRLEDSQGNELAHDDDSGGNRNARLFFTPPKEGVYRILGTSYKAASGAFTLTIRDEIQLPPLLTVEGQLAPNDPKDAVRGQPHKSYRVKLAAGRHYVIDLRSTQFDTYLRLEGPDGKQLAEDDDSGGD